MIVEQVGIWMDGRYCLNVLLQGLEKIMKDPSHDSSVNQLGFDLDCSRI
jgi:hypothetical protein